MADQESKGKEPQETEEVLIEREGQFELMSASDMQADTPPAIEDISNEPHLEPSSSLVIQDTGVVEPSSNANAEPSETALVQDTEPSADLLQGSGSSSNPVADATPSSDPIVKDTEESSKMDQDDYVDDFDDSPVSSVKDENKPPTPPSEPTPQEETAVKTLPKDLPADRTSQEMQSTEAVVKSMSEGSVPSGTAKSSAASASASGRKVPQSSVTGTGTSASATTTTATATTSTRERTISAPELRMTPRRRRIEAEMERRKLNEAAYNAWLTKKNAQIADERRLERAKNRPATREEMEEKREMCENAYKAWLQSKNREASQRRLYEQAVARSARMRCGCATPKDHENNCTTAYKKWLEMKAIQRQREREIQMKRFQEIDEVTMKVAPDIANKAYKSWIHRKNIEAREAAARRRELQKFYFEQGKRLKESLRARFQGY